MSSAHFHVTVSLLAVVLVLSLPGAPSQAAPKWSSDFATVNGTPVVHGQNADPDLDTPDPDPLTPPEPDAVDNSAGAGLYGEADGSDGVISSTNVYRYKKYGLPDAPAIPAILDPAGVAGATGMMFGNDHQSGHLHRIAHRRRGRPAVRFEQRDHRGRVFHFILHQLDYVFRHHSGALFTPTSVRRPNSDWASGWHRFILTHPRTDRRVRSSTMPRQLSMVRQQGRTGTAGG